MCSNCITRNPDDVESIPHGYRVIETENALHNSPPPSEYRHSLTSKNLPILHRPFLFQMSIVTHYCSFRKSTKSSMRKQLVSIMHGSFSGLHNSVIVGNGPNAIPVIFVAQLEDITVLGFLSTNKIKVEPKSRQNTL